MVKLSVALTSTVPPEIVPPISPDLLEAVTPLVALTVEPAWVVNLPDVAVRVAAPPVASISAPFPTVKSPVFAVTFTALPEIVPPIVPVALVTLASPVVALIFELD
ncbi:hypothetical protein BV048_01627 [Haemophilus influenzae]|nr:hypothetical protein BV048_01627 [Haemophilus influenzae]